MNQEDKRNPKTVNRWVAEIRVNGKKISDNLKNKIDNADGYIFVYYENK